MTYSLRSLVLPLLTACLLVSPALADTQPASVVKVDPHLAHIFRPNTNSPFWEATDLLPPKSGLPKPDFAQLMRRAWQRSARLAQTGPTAADWAAAVQDERQLPPSGEQRGCVRTQTLTDKGMLSIRECLERPISFAEAVGWFVAQGHGLAGLGIDRPGRFFTLDDAKDEHIVFYYSTQTLALSEVIFHSTALGAFAVGKPAAQKFQYGDFAQQIDKLRNGRWQTPPSDLSQLLERGWQRLKRINQSGPTAADWALAVKDEAAEAAASGNNSCVRTQTVTTQGVLNIRECLNRPVQAIEALDWLERRPSKGPYDGGMQFNSPGRRMVQQGDELASLYYTPGDLVLREVVFFQQALK